MRFVLAATLLIVCGIASEAHASKGTSLAVVAEAVTTQCGVTSATVEIHAAVTSTASAAPASILASIDGGLTFTNLGTVEAWVYSGRTKTAEETIEVVVPRTGTTPVEVCFIQPGADGNPSKKACAVVDVTPSCTVPPAENF